MLKIKPSAVFLFLGLILFLENGCHDVSPPNVPITKQAVPTPELPKPTLAPDQKQDTTQAIYLAVEQLFAASGTASQPTPFPSRTHVRSVTIKKGLVTLDVSREFNALPSKGDSVEAQAQKELLNLLAQFPDVKKLRLTVEGKSYESQVTDWEALPVHGGITGQASSGEAQR